MGKPVVSSENREIQTTYAATRDRAVIAQASMNVLYLILFSEKISLDRATL